MSDNIRIRIKLEQHHAEPLSPVKPRSKRVTQKPIHWQKAVFMVGFLGLLSAGYWGVTHVDSELAHTTIQESNMAVSTDVPLNPPTLAATETPVNPPVVNPALDLANIEHVEKISVPERLSPDPAYVLQPLKTTPAEIVTTPKAALTASPKAPLKSEVNTHKYIARAQLTRAIKGREPIDKLPNVLYSDEKITRLYYFTELKDMRGRRVTHQWEYRGKVMARIQFRIGGNHWRTYSSKYLNRSMFGDWKVLVTDEQGQVLHTEAFEYLASPRTLSLR